MKTNKEFIDGIYEKADEIRSNQEEKKQNNISKIINMAAVLVIIFTIGVNVNLSKQENSLENKDIVNQNYESSQEISLKTVDNFENFYNIMKNNEDSNKNVYNSIYEEVATPTESAEDSLQSKTNNQVENVDEADIVKVDNNYIYYISDKKVVIIDAKEGDSSSKVSEITYEGSNFAPNEIYVNKNKLVVICGQYDYYSSVEAIYDIARRPDNNTILIIYDITDKKEPKEERRIEIEGEYLSSRMVDSSIYFATTKYIYNQEILNSNIEELNEEDYKPKYKDTLISNEEKAIEYDSIYCFEHIETTSYLNLAGINLESREEIKIQTFLGAGNYMYSSEKNMYIAKIDTQYDDKYNFVDSSTHILKFKLDNGKIVFQAETSVQGQINNQFSMDENGEYFRIATTIGAPWNTDENTSNSLYVLNSNLEEVGKLTGFGKEERIYSVRYEKNKAYVVTFKQTDPLFVIDLTEPTNPQILGELKLPGYSTYLHPYDETHLIGFGYDTKDNGTRITTNGLKMVMFDISDLNNPKELFKVSVGDKNTSSSLTYDHKALLYSKEKNIIAFPLTTYTKNGVNTRAAIYEIDLQNGFILKGEISNEQYENNKQLVERIVYVNNTFYTLSKQLVKVVNMENLQIIKKIEI